MNFLEDPLMNRVILIYASLAVMAGCSTVPQQPASDVISQINKNILEMPSAGGAANYYVCDDGNDANDGLSVNAPWKSFEKGMAQFNNMSAGGAVLFCRGGVFPAISSPRLANFNCNTEYPCLIGDYSSPDGANSNIRPEIVSKHVGSVFNFQDGGNADHDEGYIVENLIITGQGSGLGTAIFFFNDVDDVLLENLTFNAIKIGVVVAGANKPNAGSDSLNERIYASNVDAYDVEKVSTGILNGDIVLTGETPVSEHKGVERGEPKTSVSRSYYVCDKGSDDNNGMSPNTPWKSFAKAMDEFNYLEAGEGIYFCRGGEFFVENNIRLFNTGCTREAPCTIGDYYYPPYMSDEPPKIYSLDGEGVFSFQNGGDAEPDGGYQIKNLSLVSSVPSSSAIFVYNDVDDVTIDSLTIDGFRIGIEFAGGNMANADDLVLNERMLVRNSTIINNSYQGWLGSCSDCLIDSNYFENNGFLKPILTHNIYVSSPERSSNVVISNNTLKNTTIIDGECRAVALVVHGIVDNIRIENNLIQEDIGRVSPECWGIALDPGYAEIEESFNDVVIKGNTLVNMGNVAIGCASCVNVLIEENVILNEQDFGYSAIKVPTKKEGAVKSSDVVIRRNIINLQSPLNKRKSGINLGSQIKNKTFQGNKVYIDSDIHNCIVLDGVKYEDGSSCSLFY